MFDWLWMSTFCIDVYSISHASSESPQWAIKSRTLYSSFMLGFWKVPYSISILMHGIFIWNIEFWSAFYWPLCYWILCMCNSTHHFLRCFRNNAIITFSYWSKKSKTLLMFLGFVYPFNALLLFISPTEQRIPLDFLSAEKFRSAAENYVRPFLTKVPFFYCVSDLYLMKTWCMNCFQFFMHI